MWSRFHALIPYFGGKRALCPVIFKAISRSIPTQAWPRTTLLDGFCGGGAVSLFAKAQGMRVISAFNGPEARRLLQDLLRAARKFQVVVLSYGSQRYSAEEFEETVKAVEPMAEVCRVNLRYPFTRKTDAEAVRKELLTVVVH